MEAPNPPAGETVTPVKRARMRSKYLSPPYTDGTAAADANHISTILAGEEEFVPDFVPDNVAVPEMLSALHAAALGLDVPQSPSQLRLLIPFFVLHRRKNAVVSVNNKRGKDASDSDDDGQGSGSNKRSKKKKSKEIGQVKLQDIRSRLKFGVLDKKLVFEPMKLAQEKILVNNGSVGERLMNAGRAMSCDESEKKNIKGTKEADSSQGDIGVHPNAEKSKAKQKKGSKPMCGADHAHVLSDVISTSVQKKNKKKKKNVVLHFANPAALLLEFAQDAVLPSKEELLSAFRRFGFVIESKTEIVKDARSARVVFGKIADAEAAYTSAELLSTFGPPSTTVQLQHLPPITLSTPQSPLPNAKLPLTDIRKNLEKMISSLQTGSSSLKKASSPDGSKPTVDNLVMEMRGLLAKVDRMLNGPTTTPHP